MAMMVLTLVAAGGAAWMLRGESIARPTTSTPGTAGTPALAVSNAAMSHAEAGEPFVVLELFTSEGCSSCPPADDNLARLQKQARDRKLRVVPLAFHVDYWNALGWTDRFSQRVFTDRQRRYARDREEESIYTPQLIANGLYGFNGSDRATSDKVVKELLGFPSRHGVTLSRKSPQETTSPEIQVGYRVDDLEGGKPLARDLVLNLAVVSDREESRVTSGENAGRKLQHVAVVQWFDVMPLEAAEGIRSIPRAALSKGNRLVAYVQSKSTRAITGVATVDAL